MSIAKEEIEAVRAKADIVQVVGHYIPLKPEGKKYVGLCPFHDDHNPSFTVDPDKQFCYCFVCHNGGDVFKFVELYEHVSFPEAVSKVADLVGYTLSSSARISTYVHKEDPHIAALHHVLQESIRFTEKMLMANRGRQALKYLQARGLDADEIRKFQIGYDPGKNDLYQYLKQQGISDQNMIDAYVIRQGDYGTYDIFSQRVTFPIHDFHGRPVGFTARAMNPQAKGKYINTSETDLYAKRRLVYNAHRALHKARSSGKLYVCEGVMDVIAFDRAGIENAVCTLGTACTEEQIGVMRRLAQQIIFCYDGDDAGQNATWRAVTMARDAGMDTAVVLNDTGKDPDEIIRDGGKEALQELVSHTLSWFEFYLRYMANRMNLDSYLEKKEFLTRAKEQYGYLRDDMDRSYYRELVEKTCGLPLETGERQSRWQKKPVERHGSGVIPDGEKEAERQVLITMMKDPSAGEIYRQELGYMNDPVNDALANLILSSISKTGLAEPYELLHETEDPAVAKRINEIYTSEAWNMDPDINAMKGAISRIQIQFYTEQSKQLKHRLDTSSDADEKKALVQQYRDTLIQLRRLYNEQSR